jgi:hypothetical protein
MLSRVLQVSRERIKQLPLLEYFFAGRSLMRQPEYRLGEAESTRELVKQPSRTDVINFLLSTFGRDTAYLEIGVRNPDDNFNRIRAQRKWSVDPGIEYAGNPVDFPVTSDEFFAALRAGRSGVLDATTRFDVIFLDGLHAAEQLDRDITNALDFLAGDGFVVLHDCNPPTEWHAREAYGFSMSPARGYWNGTSWKAFFKARTRQDLYSCCVDCDWGVGVLSKMHRIGEPTALPNPFFEYSVMAGNRRHALNLVGFDSLVSAVRGTTR